AIHTHAGSSPVSQVVTGVVSTWQRWTAWYRRPHTGLRPAASSRAAPRAGTSVPRSHRACWKRHLTMRRVAISTTPISWIVLAWTRCGAIARILSRPLDRLRKRRQTYEYHGASTVGAAFEEVFPCADEVVPAGGL